MEPDSILQTFLNLRGDLQSGVDTYINDLIGEAQGDYDFAIKQIDREHKLALGSDDQARAKFFEDVADKLEERIGRIPYDYQVGTTRTREDLARVEDVTTRNRDRALERLAEDEQVWRQQFTDESKIAREGQQESLLERGILSGTRNEAQGLAGENVKTLEQGLGETMEAFNRALGRQRTDINTQAEDTLFEARRGATRNLEDLKTGARRGGIDSQDKFQFGTEAQQRLLDSRKKELERQRQKQKEQAETAAAVKTGYIYNY